MSGYADGVFWFCTAHEHTVFVDLNEDGLYDAGEELAGATVELFEADGITPATDADGVLVTADVTAADGLYLFDNLLPGDYVVQVTPPAGYEATTPQVADANTDIDGDSNIATEPSDGVFQSGVVTLSSSDEPTDDGDSDANTNLSVDFGFVPPLSLGDTVFEDSDNDGVLDAGEELAGATVELFEADGITPATDADGVLIPAQVTGIDGLYEFDNLAPGDYVVQVTPPVGYEATTPQVADPNTDIDDDSNIATEPSDGVFQSGVVTLSVADEPDTASDGDDTNSNATVDFGFVPPMSLGDTVFVDLNEDGLYDAGEELAGATVELFEADGTTPATDADGAPVPSDTTAADGLYLFDNLAPGDYVVKVTPPNGYEATVSQVVDPNTDIDDDSNIASEPVDGEFYSGVVTLSTNDEPADDGDTDTNSNLSVDFGFAPQLSLGDTIFVDLNEDGLYDAGEELAGTTVALFEARWQRRLRPTPMVY